VELGTAERQGVGTSSQGAEEILLRGRGGSAVVGMTTESAPVGVGELPARSGRRRRPVAPASVDGRRRVTGLVEPASDAGRPRAAATARRRSDPGPPVPTRPAAPSASSATAPPRRSR
jgi:hypothetical protein